MMIDLEILLAGAVEAAEIVSQRAVAAQVDRVYESVEGVRETTDGLSVAIRQLQSTVGVLGKGYSEFSQAVRGDILEALSGITEAAQAAAAQTAGEHTQRAADTLAATVAEQTRALSAKLLAYVDERHDVAVRAQQDGLVVRFDELKRALEHDMESIVAEASTTRKQFVDEVRDDARQTVVTAREEMETHASSVATETTQACEAALARVEETTSKMVDAMKTEVFLSTDKLVADTEAKVEASLAAIEVLPGPPGPPGTDGADGADGVDGTDGAQGVPGEKGDPGPPGRDGADGADGVLTRVSEWYAKDWARKDVVSHAGGVWQARADTDEEPGRSVHWRSLVAGIACVERARDDHLLLRSSTNEVFDLGECRGPPGKTSVHRGTYDEKESYQEKDEVISKGSTYVARRDGPGVCPGPGWQMVAQRGKQGPPGKRGPRGFEGKAGVPGVQGPPGQAFQWRGKYDPAATYAFYDVVHHNYAVWICLRDGVSGIVPIADQVNWDLFLRGGAGGGGAGAGVGTDELVAVSGTDTSPGTLIQKLQSGDGSVVFTTLNPGSDEKLDLQATGTGGGQANVGQNLGIGTGIYRGMNGVALTFASVADTARITASLSPSDELELMVPDGVFIVEPPDDGEHKLARQAAGVVSWESAGGAALLDVGTGTGDVAAGDAPAAAASSAVSAHDANGNAHGGNIMTSTQTAAMDANATLSGSNPVASIADIPVEVIDLSSGVQPSGKIAVSDGAGGLIYQDKPAGGIGGSGFERTYEYDSNTNPGAAAGQFRLNNAVPVSVTAIYFHETDQNGFFLGAIAANLDVDDRISFADASGNVRTYKITGTPTETGGEWTIPCVDDGGSLTFTDAQLYTALFAAGEAGEAVVWGDIGGTIGNQTDLMVELAQAKARANHTGTQTLVTISDAGTAAAQNVGLAVGDVTQLQDVGGGTPGFGVIDGRNLTNLPGGGGGDMTKEVYDPGNVNADAFARGNHTGTQTLVTISDAGTAAAQNVGLAVGDVTQLQDVGGGTPGFGVIDGRNLTNLPGGGGWSDGTTIGYWNLTRQDLGNVSGAAAVDLDNGAVVTAVMTAPTTFTFSSTSGMTNMPFWLLLTSGGFSPTFAYTGATIHDPDGVDWATGSIFSVSFMKIGNDVDYSQNWRS